MQILTMDVGEVFFINDNIKVLIMDVHGCQVRFGIAAPRHISVDREEIYYQKKLNPRIDITAYDADPSN